MCWGRRQPRLILYSVSPLWARTPSIVLIPGHTPPESCHPPPEPPSHSPRIAREAIMSRSCSVGVPSNWRVCCVARIRILIIDASKFVETAKRDPFGMSLTFVTSSIPSPGNAILSRISLMVKRVPSNDGGIKPDAMTAAFSKPM